MVELGLVPGWRVVVVVSGCGVRVSGQNLCGFGGISLKGVGVMFV